MADDITDVYVATEAGDAGWQSLTALVEAKLPIESVDGKVELTGESQTFDVKINGVSQLTVGNDIDFNIPFNNGQFTITGSSYTQQRIQSSKGGCVTQYTAAGGKSYFVGMNDLYGFQVIGTKFVNTKMSATDDTFQVFGSPIYTDGVWGSGVKQLVIDPSKAEFSIPVWAPRIVGGADNAAFVNLGNSVQIQAGTTSGEVVIDSGTTELKVIRDAKVAIEGQNTTQLQVATSADYCFIQTTNKDNRSFYHGQDPDGWSVYYTGSAKALGCNADGVFKFEKSFCTPGVQGYNSTDASITIGLELLTNNYTPSSSNAIATVQYVLDNAGESYDDTQIKADLASEASTRSAADTTLQNNINDLIWVGTQQEYDALGIYRSQTLYAITD